MWVVGFNIRGYDTGETSVAASVTEKEKKEE